jgi:hypothetical protein
MSIDERIKSAGSRLASTQVGVPDLERLIRRRSRYARVTAAVSSLAVVAIGVAALIVYDRSREQSATEPTATSGNVATDAPSPRYELVLDGATPTPVESLTASSTDTAVWINEDTQTYLTLVVRPGLALRVQVPTGLGPVVEDTSFPTDHGRVWFTTIGDAAVRHITMWWSRPNGDLWLLDSYWYGHNPVNTTDGRRTLREWAQAITAPDQIDPQQQYRLADPSMRRLATDRGGEVESRAQVWNYRVGSVLDKITLLSIQDTGASGRANLLARGKPEAVLIDGHDAWQVIDSTTGEIQIGWQTGNARPTWNTLTVPARLAPLTPQIRAALQLR